MYLKLDDLKGEVLDKEHGGEIEILSFNFGTDSTHTIFGAGKPEIGNIDLIKYLDTATPELIRRVLSGERFKEGKLSLIESSVGVAQPVVTFTLRDVMISSHTSGSYGGEDRLTEKIGLNFANFTYQTFSYSDIGKQTADPSVTWDIIENTGSIGGSANSSPAITSIANQVLNEDSAVTVPFTISDVETPTGALILSRSTTDPTIVPIAGITFGGYGSDRNVTITPTPNAFGTAMITITVTDLGGLTASRSFTVTVNPVNDPPVIQTILDQITLQNTALIVPISVTDIDIPANTIAFTASSNDPALMPATRISFSGSGTATQMTLTPIVGAHGVARITLTARDGLADSAPVSFNLTVNPLNQGPTNIQLTGPGDTSPVVVENASANTLIGTLLATDPDASDAITYQLLDSAGGRFKLAGSALNQIAVANGTALDFEATSSHQITVRATDSALHAFDKALTISVLNVNEPPVITTSPNPPFAAGSSRAVTGISVTDPDSGTAAIEVNLTVAQGTLHLTETSGLVGKITGNGSAAVRVTAPVSAINTALQSSGLVFSTIGVTSGAYPLLVQASDLGNAGLGVAQTASASIDLTVQASQFDQWRARWFNPTQLADPAVSGPHADPDHDQVANLLEYAVDSNPNNPQEGPGRVEWIKHSLNGTDYPALRFKRLKNSLDPALRIQVEVATDAFNWRSEPADTVVVSSVSFDPTRDQVVIRSSLPLAGVPRQLLRLRVTLLPTAP